MTSGWEDYNSSLATKGFEVEEKGAVNQMWSAAKHIPGAFSKGSQAATAAGKSGAMGGLKNVGKIAKHQGKQTWDKTKQAYQNLGPEGQKFAKRAAAATGLAGAGTGYLQARGSQPQIYLQGYEGDMVVKRAGKLMSGARKMASAGAAKKVGPKKPTIQQIQSMKMAKAQASPSVKHSMRQIGYKGELETK